MPKYEFFVSVKYTKTIEVEADDRDQRLDLSEHLPHHPESLIRLRARAF